MKKEKNDYSIAYLDAWQLVVSSLFTAKDKLEDLNPSVSSVLDLFLQRVRDIGTRFKTKNIVFAWTDRTSLRAKILPEYKDNIMNTRPEVTCVHDDYIPEIQKALARIGFINQFLVPEMEFFDITAHFQKEYPDEKGLLITDIKAGMLVMSLINKNTDFIAIGKLKYGNNAVYTLEDFVHQFGISPDQWSELIAYKGYKWNNINGTPKMGFKTALKYLTGGGIPRYTDLIRESHQDYVDKVLEALTYPLLPLNLELRDNAFDLAECTEVLLEHKLHSELDKKFWKEIDA